MTTSKQSKGGKKAARNMTATARRERARQGGYGLAAKLTPAERTASARRAVRARWAKAKPSDA